MPLTFFTLRGSTYTGLPTDVLPISFQRLCAPDASSGAAEKQDRENWDAHGYTMHVTASVRQSSFCRSVG